MGRQVRRVPADWQHPIDGSGEYIPLFNGSFAERLASWQLQKEKWEAGFVFDESTRGQDEPKWEPRQDYLLTISYTDWNGEEPTHIEYMPDWPEAEKTHWQMYENTSEGTPISPVLESPEMLARWLTDNNASAFADLTATYEQWLATIGKGGSGISMAATSSGQIVSGVELTGRYE